MAWLPPIDPLANHGGDWAVYEASLRVTFEQHFVQSIPMLDGKPCYISMAAADQFWHLISTGLGAQANRVPDLRRCERLCWVRPMIEAVARGEANMWRVKRKKQRTRVHVALPDFSHLIVLSETKKVMLLITAYRIPSNHQRAKLQTGWLADPNHLP